MKLIDQLPTALATLDATKIADVVGTLRRGIVGATVPEPIQSS
jgi:hypothetical protein